MNSNYKSHIFLLPLLIIITLSGCTKMPPKCSDEETLNLVREIIFGKEYTEKELKDNIIFEYPLATAEDKNIKKLSCEARLKVANAYQLPITYASQLDDKNQHIVSVGGFNQDDKFLMLITISNAVKKTRIPVESEKTKVSPKHTEETQDTQLQSNTESAKHTTEQIKQNHSIRQAVINGNTLTNEYPRFKDYAVSEIYSGPTAPLDTSGDTARTFKTRLREALSEGEISAAGEYTLAGWGCGMSCFINTFVNKRTGQVIEDGIGGESGEGIVGLDMHSRLIITEGPELNEKFEEIGYFAFFYELADTKLTLIKKVPIPRALDE